jgi:D-alanyl-D-alanine dipeptidase
MPARTLLIALTVVLAGSLCASASAADLVDVRRYASSIQVDVRDATANNFTGARPGAEGLRRLPPGARLAGDGALARRTDNGELLRDGYIAPKSNHNLESTVDLTLIRRASGRQLDMNTAFDAFTPRANTTRARGRVLRNRLIPRTPWKTRASSTTYVSGGTSIQRRPEPGGSTCP